MKTPRSIACLLVSALVACSAQGGNSLPTPTSDVPSGGGANCAALCMRIANASGCASMPNCEANCMTAASQVPAACRSSYDTFLACANTSGVVCSGGNPQFSNCNAQMSAVGQCISNILLDGGVTPPADAEPPPPRDASGPPGNPTAPCATDMSGPSRECGWNPGVNFTCTPGQMFLVGCNSTAGSGPACAAPLGTCMGDTVVRVCSGSAPCSSSDELDSADDTCGTCAVATITCPASGMIHVLTGSFRTSSMTTCVPAVRPVTLN